MVDGLSHNCRLLQASVILWYWKLIHGMFIDPYIIMLPQHTFSSYLVTQIGKINQHLLDLKQLEKPI